jgi:preprotein translocase subunit SecY
MVSNIDKITLFPALLAFALSAYMAFLNLQVTDYSTKVDLLNWATVLFIVGTLFTAGWIVMWLIRLGSEKME